MRFFKNLKASLKYKLNQWYWYWDEIEDETHNHDKKYWREPQTEGIRFFDLVKIHLKDHGYHTRLYRDANLIIVFDSWIRYFFDSRPGMIAFEVGYDPTRPQASIKEHNAVWAFGFKTPGGLYASSADECYAPRVVCKMTDLDCLDRILKEVTQHFEGPCGSSKANH